MDSGARPRLSTHAKTPGVFKPHAARCFSNEERTMARSLLDKRAIFLCFEVGPFVRMVVMTNTTEYRDTEQKGAGNTLLIL
jgi:hypothetical protein